MILTVASPGLGRSKPHAPAKGGCWDGSVMPMRPSHPKVAATVAQFTYVSTAGGAFLRWLEGRTLPGNSALMQDKKV